MLLAGNLLSEIIKRLLVCLGQHRLVGAKQDGGIGGCLVVVEVLDGSRQPVQATGHVSSFLVSLLGGLSRSAGFFVSLISGLNALLSLAIDIFDIASVLRRDFVEFADLVVNRRNLALHIFLGCASDSREHAACDQYCDKRNSAHCINSCKVASTPTEVCK